MKYKYSVSYQTFNPNNNEFYEKSTWVRSKSGQELTPKGISRLLKNQCKDVFIVGILKIIKWNYK